MQCANLHDGILSRPVFFLLLVGVTALYLISIILLYRKFRRAKQKADRLICKAAQENGADKQQFLTGKYTSHPQSESDTD